MYREKSYFIFESLPFANVAIEKTSQQDISKSIQARGWKLGQLKENDKKDFLMIIFKKK